MYFSHLRYFPLSFSISYFPFLFLIFSSPIFSIPLFSKTVIFNPTQQSSVDHPATFPLRLFTLSISTMSLAKLDWPTCRKIQNPPPPNHHLHPLTPNKKPQIKSNSKSNPHPKSKVLCFLVYIDHKEFIYIYNLSYI